jgi:hypothetical protein
MKKKPASRFPRTKAGSRSPVDAWHGGGDIEIRQYARSLQKSAKSLVANLNGDQNSRTDWDACPVMLLYRQALEIHLKMLVGEGSNFLPSATDPISLFRTTSLRWLAQVASQIIKKVGWESEFKCEGVSSLSEFSALEFQQSRRNLMGVYISSFQDFDRSLNQLEACLYGLHPCREAHSCGAGCRNRSSFIVMPRPSRGLRGPPVALGRIANS